MELIHFVPLSWEMKEEEIKEGLKPL